MFYFTTGTAEQIIADFAPENPFYTIKNTNKNGIEQDLHRSLFLGNAEEWQHFYDAWSPLSNDTPDYYAQGDMTSANLWILFRDTIDGMALNEKGVPLLSQFYFAFVDNDHTVCGLSFFYSKHDPSHWMIGFIKNTHFPEAEKTICLLSTFNPNTKRKSNQSTTQVVENTSDIWSGMFRSPRISSLIKQIIRADGTINPKTDLLNFCTNSQNPDEPFPDSQAMLDLIEKDVSKFLDNPLLQKLNQLSNSWPNILPRQILACLDEDSQLSNVLNRIISDKIGQYRFGPMSSRDDMKKNTLYPGRIKGSILEYSFLDDKKRLDRAEIDLGEIETSHITSEYLNQPAVILKIISEQEHAQTERNNITCLIQTAIKLDQFGLLDHFDKLAQDITFINFLEHNSLFSEHQDLFKAWIQDEKKFQILRFLSQCVTPLQLINEIKEKSHTVNWTSLSKLATLKFDATHSPFLKTVVFKLVLDDPKLDSRNVVSLVLTLKDAPSLTHFFTPFQFARLLSENRDPSTFKKTINEIHNDLKLILNKHKEASSEFLQTLGEMYLNSENHRIPHIFIHHCKDEEQIEACKILLHLNLDENLIIETLNQPCLVWAVKRASQLNLQSNIPHLLQNKSWRISALQYIHDKPSYNYKKVMLPLLLKDKIASEEEFSQLDAILSKDRLLEKLIDLSERNYPIDDLHAFLLKPMGSEFIQFIHANQLPFDKDKPDNKQKLELLYFLYEKGSLSDFSEAFQKQSSSLDWEKLFELGHLALNATSFSVTVIFQLAFDYPSLSINELHGVINALESAPNLTHFFSPLKFARFLSKKSDQSTFEQTIANAQNDLQKIYDTHHHLPPASLRILGKMYLERLDHTLLQRFNTRKTEEEIKAYNILMTMEIDEAFIDEVLNKPSRVWAVIKAYDLGFQDDIPDLLLKNKSALEEHYYKADSNLKRICLPLLLEDDFSSQEEFSTLNKILSKDNLSEKLIDLSERNYPFKFLKALLIAPLGKDIINFIHTNQLPFEEDMLEKNEIKDYEKILNWVKEENAGNKKMAAHVATHIIPFMQPERFLQYQNKMASLKEPGTNKYAIETALRLEFIYRLRNLGIENEKIYLLFDEDNSKKFYNLILKIEYKFDQIREHLDKSYAGEQNTKFGEFLIAENTCRMQMYELIYDQLKDAKPEQAFRNQLQHIQAPLLEIADKDKDDLHKFLRKTMKVITNFLCLFLFGLPNVYHKNKTGDFLFYARPKTSTAIQELDQEILDIIKSENNESPPSCE